MKNSNLVFWSKWIYDFYKMIKLSSIRLIRPKKWRMEKRRVDSNIAIDKNIFLSQIINSFYHPKTLVLNMALFLSEWTKKIFIIWPSWLSSTSWFQVFFQPSDPSILRVSLFHDKFSLSQDKSLNLYFCFERYRMKRKLFNWTFREKSECRMYVIAQVDHSFNFFQKNLQKDFRG